jgi:hypothetical protein
MDRELAVLIEAMDYFKKKMPKSLLSTNPIPLSLMGKPL